MTPLSAADQVAIDQLNLRYAHTTDTGDGPGFAACFTPDGVFESSTAGAIAGSDALVRFVERVAANDLSSARTHWISPALVTHRGDRIVATCNAMVVEGGPNPTIVAAVRYDDELDKSTAGWRFKRRTVVRRQEPGRD